MSDILWSPLRGECQLDGFVRFVNHRGFGRLPISADGDADFAAIHQWSVQNADLFWLALWRFCGVIGEPGDIALVRRLQMPGAMFFPNGRLNFAENILNFGGGGRGMKDSRVCGNDEKQKSDGKKNNSERDDGERNAIIALREDGGREVISRAQLRAQTMRLAGWLQQQGVKKGDRVAAYMPNCPQTIVMMLATTAIGAVFSSCSVDFGVDGVIDRFGQITPKILFAAAGYAYRGEFISRQNEVVSLARRLPSLNKIVLLSYPPDSPKGKSAQQQIRQQTKQTDTELWDNIIGGGDAFVLRRFVDTAFNDPAFVLYSSGTTGKPKCIIHSGGGVLLQHLKEHRLHNDICDGEVFFYFTTCGWMMWNWLVGGLASGAAIVLYEGDPFYPSPSALWDIAARESINIFGVSAKYIDALRHLRFSPPSPLPHLRMLLSTGSPLSPDAFDYVYDNIKADVHLASISGGTDIVSCFVLGNPWQKVRRGEIQGCGLAMAADVFDDNGESLSDAAGELVCSSPFPSMPLGFWADDDGKQYRAAYFGKYANIWHHGDWAMRKSSSGGFVIYGRSDATLNPGGIRIGTAELYRPVEALAEVMESVAVGQRHKDGERVVLFVKLAEGYQLDNALREKIKTAIRQSATPRHLPAKIIAVDDIPRTRSGKISEIAVRDTIHNIAVKNRAALANPQSLLLFADIPQLKE